MTPSPTVQSTDRTRRLNTWLYVAVVLLVCATVVVGLLVFRPAWQDRASASSLTTSEQTGEDVPAETYGEVLRAATRVATAFVNVDYRDFDESIEKVRAGSTGDFKKQYKASTEELRRLMTENKAIMTSDVLAAGVVTISAKKARVLVSTSGTVRNTSTKGDDYAREMRLQLDLAQVRGAWLVNDVQFVG